MDKSTKTIAELAIEEPKAIAVLERWKIDYCCNGQRTVDEACASAGVTVTELRDEIGRTRGVTETRDWSNESLTLLQSWIVESHHAFTKQTLETVKVLADKVASRHGTNHPEMHVVDKLVRQLYDDLMPHMLKEELVLFPYVEQLEKAAKRGGQTPEACFGSVMNPIRMMMLEHESAGEILIDLRTATDDYVLPEDACASFTALYEQLTALESDLHRHIHLENNVLFQRAATMEAEIRNDVVVCVY